MGDVQKLREHQVEPEQVIDTAMSLAMREAGLVAGFSYFMRADGRGYGTLSSGFHEMSIEQKREMTKRVGKMHRQLVDNLRRLDRNGEDK